MTPTTDFYCPVPAWPTEELQAQMPKEMLKGARDTSDKDA